MANVKKLIEVKPEVHKRLKMFVVENDYKTFGNAISELLDNASNAS